MRKMIMAALLTVFLMFCFTACKEEVNTDIPLDNGRSTVASAKSTTANSTASSTTSDITEIKKHTTTSALKTTTTTGQRMTTILRTSTTHKKTTMTTRNISNTTSKADKLTLITNENLRHDKVMLELNKKRADTIKYYEIQIDALGGEPAYYISSSEQANIRTDYAMKMSRLEMSISQLERDPTQDARREQAKKEKELANIKEEYEQWEEQMATQNIVKELLREKNNLLSQIDNEIYQENLLHNENLSKINK